jgi:hypothetical protein
MFTVLAPRVYGDDKGKGTGLTKKEPVLTEKVERVLVPRVYGDDKGKGTGLTKVMRK